MDQPWRLIKRPAGPQKAQPQLHQPDSPRAELENTSPIGIMIGEQTRLFSKRFFAAVLASVVLQGHGSRRRGNTLLLPRLPAWEVREHTTNKLDQPAPAGFQNRITALAPLAQSPLPANPARTPDALTTQPTPSRTALIFSQVFSNDW